MTELLAKQQMLLQSVARALTNFKKLGKNNYSAAKIRSRILNLKETWAQCVEVQAALVAAHPAASPKDIADVRNREFENHEELFQAALDYMTECLEELEPHPLSSTGLASPSFRCGSNADRSLSHLPPIGIPPFSGRLEDWESFRDRFTSLIIQNKDVSAFARMHFLASSLSGRALESIETIPITAENFEIAWQILMSRYDNRRRLIEVHVSALCNLPNVPRESAFELTDLRDKANRAIASLKGLNRSSDEILNDILVHLVQQKLDHSTRKAWKLKGSDGNQIPSYNDLDRFIAARARALEELTPLNPIKSSRPMNSRASSVNIATAPQASCPICGASHFLNKCPRFIKASSSQRMELVKRERRCINCLSAKHALSACPSKYSCRSCNKKHHSMLHVDSAPPATVSAACATAAIATEAGVPVATTLAAPAPNTSSRSPSAAIGGRDAVALLTASALPSMPSVLLATARVVVRSVTGRCVTVRALIDQGSEVTFISSHLERTLKLRRTRMSLSISAIGGVDAGVCRFAAPILVSPVDGSTPVLSVTASILKSLTRYAPAVNRSQIDLDHLADLALADPRLVSADPIDLIIGADLYGKIILEGIRRGDGGQPIAQKTIFGWVVSGPTPTSPSAHRTITVQLCSEFASDSLEQALKRFWEIEDVPPRALLSPEEQRCEDYFLATHSREADGRYIVRLPFRQDPPIDIGKSRDIAERCLKRLLRRLEADSALQEEYSNFMRDYEALGHMKVATRSSESSQIVYIPHHPVVRDSSTTTRLRVVFNASSLTSNARSLNDHLLPGPKLQSDLAAVILRWRQFRYVYSADIAKMYRQIRVDPRDIDYQRILWCDRGTGSIQEYQLSTVTYGTASAPFLALRVLRQLVRDEGHAFPLAVPVLTENIYVDDVLFGADDIPMLRQIREQVSSLLRRGQLELRKWSSNSAILLRDIENQDHGLACSRDLQPDEHLKVLGIGWLPSTDVLQFRISCPPLNTITKRTILSTIAKLFDPLGWSTPVTIVAKVFLQRLWLLRVDWDEPLAPEYAHQWAAIRSSLLELDGLQLSRWMQRGSDSVACELHGFSDASNNAYAAAVYLRIASVSGEVTSMLLVGKARVAPVKTLSVPRLELAAAVLLSRLLEFVITSLQLSDVPCYCWTDSTVVLAWVTQHPSKWKTFVSNRVSEIQSRISRASWRHVSTVDNPADCASRGISGNQLASHPLWWHGPLWLRLPSQEWPTSVTAPETTMERNLSQRALVVQTRQPWDLAERFSSWPKLIRVTAYILRFGSRLRKGARSGIQGESPSSLTAAEFNQAKVFWLKTIQSELFPLELRALLQHRPLPAKSTLLPLNPFLDDEQLIHVGGRLTQAPISAGRKHPIILASHPLVRLIIHNVHLRTMHAGIQLTISTLRGDFWVIRARSVVKSVLHRCVVCARERAASTTQLMGDLPKVRVSPPTRAFLNCGLDYAGPVSIRALPGRGRTSRKAYIAVFVCMATRAVHLELVDGYSTSAFLGAFHRFIARRGLPNSMYSDNGTTFVGADREMTAAFHAALRDPAFLNKIASDSVSWHFMPPAAPHFGGLWEAGVRSVKHHLRRVVGAHTLTYEEFSTLLCSVEACLNSRPLAPLTDSLEDYEPLTPGHFLIGAALNSLPEPSVLSVRENRLTRWQIVQQLRERFWKLWQTDYLNTLQQRAKWRCIRVPELKVGQMVTLRNQFLPPCKWELGRISQCHPGLDGLTRVVTVKTASAEYKRPISKLCVLPIDVELAESSRSDSSDHSP